MWARVLLGIVVLSLVYSLVRIQVVRAEEFATVARENMLRPVTVRAPRGTIYDRHGRVIAENRVAYSIQLMPAAEDSLRAQVEALRPVLGLTDDGIESAFRRYRASPNRPMAVVSDASMDQVARLEERRRDFTHVLIHEYPQRHYPAGEAIAAQIPEVRHVTRYATGGPLTLRYETRTFYEDRFVGVDPAFFAMFTFPFLAGDPATALQDPYSIVLTAPTAAKYFPEGDALGQMMMVDNTHPVTVTGVIEKVPHTSSLQFDFVVPLDKGELSRVRHRPDDD